MLFGENVLRAQWVDAFSSAIYIINQLPSSLLQNKSPFELLYHSIPIYKNFKVFGCRVFPYLRPYTSHKLEPISNECVFFGYISQYKGYKCLDPSTNRVYITRHAHFDESGFPFSRKNISC